MKLLIPRNSRSTRRALTSCLLSFAILIMPFAQIAAARSSVNQTRRGTSPTPGSPAGQPGRAGTVREGSSAPDQQRAAAKDLFVAPVGTTLSTTLSAAITPTGNNGDGKADPGDTITYTATITNTGASDATSVSFTDTVDLSTTLISGSGVMALDDHFNTIGNVDLNVPVGQGLLVNDKDITAGNNTGMTASGGTSSAQGGTVAISSNGSFTYTPPVGFTGSDTFTYTATTAGGKTATATARIAIASKVWFINNNAGACASTCDGRLSHPFTTIASFNAVNDNGVALSHPKIGDPIFIFESATNYTGPVTLLNTQTLIGQDATASLISITGLTQPSGTDPLPVMNSGNGTIVNITSASNAIPILVGNSNTLRGFTVGNTTGAKIISTGANFGTLTTNDLTLTGTGQALNLTSGTLAATFNNITSTSAAGAAGISLATVGGSLTVSGTTAISNTGNEGIKITGSSLTGNFGTTNITSPGLSGISISTTTGNITFGATTITNGIEGVDLNGNSAGTRTFGSLSVTGSSANAFNHSSNGTFGGGSVTVTGTTTLSCAGNAISVSQPSSGNLIDFQGATSATSTGAGAATGVNWAGAAGATMQFNALTIQTTGGIGLNASGGGTITVTNGTGTINNTTQAAPAIVANGVGLNANFSAINSSGGASGVSLTNVTGSSSFANGTISGNSGDAFVVSGSTSSVTYNGTIASGSAHSVNVNGKSSGTVNFGGAITDSDTGVSLTSNSGATINFTGGLSLSTVGNDAFTATGGGVVNVSGTNNITTTLGKGINWSADTSSTGVTFNNISSTTGGAVIIASSGASNFTFNDVTSTTGTAVNVNTSTGDFVFHKISSNGAAKGITVTALTGGGSFTVTGTGGSGLCDSTHIGASDCQGGTIQGGTTRGAEFTNAVGVTLNNMYFKGNGTTAISTGSGCVDSNSAGGSNVACNAALYLVSATTVGLNKIYLDGTGSADMGLNGNAVSGLTVNGLEIANFTGNQKDAATLQNLTGTSGFTGLKVHNNSLAHNFFVSNVSGTANMTFTSPVINTSPFSGSGNADGLQVDSYASASVTVSATNVNISNLAGNSVSFQASSGSTMVATLNGGTSTLTNGILMQSTGDNTHFTYTVTNLSSITTNALGSNAITVGKANGTGTATTTGTVTNNIIGNSPFDGINLNAYGAGGSSSVTVAGNTISNTNRAISATAGQGATSFNVVIQTNTINAPNAGTFAYAIDIVDGTQSGDAHCLFLNLGDMSVGHTVPANKNNITTTGWQSGGNPIEITQFNNTTFKILNFPGGGDAGAASWVTASNTIAGGLGTDAFHLAPSSGFISGTACPLLLALGGISSVHDMFPLVRSFDGSEVSEVSVTSLASPVSTVSNSLSQSQLDSIVAASIQRWSATGLTQQQIATLRGIKFEVTDLSGSYLGEADGNRIQVDRDAEGKGWFVDASPMSDASFAHAVSATRRYTDPMNAAAGHVDLLTAIEHEMGHRLGLDDKYAERDRDSIMYGYLTVGERRLPARGQAKDVQASSLASAHFLTLGSNDRIPAGDEFNSRGQRPRIDAASNGSDPVRVASIRPLQGRHARMDRLPVALPPAIESHAFGVNQRGHIALLRSAANTLGAGLYKHFVATGRRSNHARTRTTAPLTPVVGGTITISIGTLKPGDSAQITFQVTLNSPPDLAGVPPGTAQVSTHGTVTGSNFSSPQDTNTVNTLVDRYDVTNVLAASPNPSDQGVQVTLTATVSPVGTPPATVGGFVNFIDTSNANAVICNAPLNSGVATCQTSSLTSSTHNVRADYLGDGNFDPLSSNVLAQVVNECTSNPIVTSTLDSGANTLRDALLHVCTQPNDNITFNLGAGAHTITTLSTLVIAKNANITNTLSAGNGPLTIDANGGAFRVFRVDSPVTLASLSNFTIKGAASSASGAGLLVQSGTVTLTGMLFTANTVISGSGGGASVTGGATLNIRNSTFSGNKATNGGALYNSGGILNLLNVTVTKNNANGDVGTGACPAAGSVNGEGGAIDNGSSTTNVKNSILAGNTACNTGILNISGTITDQGNNLLSGDPRLAALADNGGASWTHALLVDSPALDGGDNSAATTAGLTTDQRGTSFPRIADSADSDTTVTVDIGAVELHPSVEDISDKSTVEDTPLSFGFNIGDGTGALITSVTASSGNTALVPNDVAHLSVSGSGSTRTLNITPAANANSTANGTATITVTVTAINGQTAQDTFVLTVNAVNDPPSFIKGANQTVNEDAGAQTVNGWATSISAGAADETGQTLTFNVSVTGATGSLAFSSGPAMDPTTGNLTYTTTADTNGTANISVTLSDNGSNTPPNSNTSAPQTFTITVNAVNDPPSFVKGSNPTVAEDAGPQSVSGWATSISQGPGESGQTLAFNITPNGTTGNLAFSSGPAIDASGNLTYTSSANTNGSATFNVSLSDNGSNTSPNSNTSGLQSFTINVSAVNDAPTFQIPSNPPAVNEDVALQTVNSFATNFQPGPLTATDESGQTLVGYTVTSTGSTGGLTFTNGPSIDNAGKLTYTPTADKAGTATFNVVATDSGSGTVPNVNQSVAVSFTITVNGVNDAPVLDNTGNMSLTAVNEDVANASNPGTLVSDVIASAGGDRITDVDSGAIEGIAVTAVDNTNGAWQFSIDNGANWIAFGTPNTLNTRLLASNALTRVHFVPGANFNGTIDPGITFRAWDQTSGVNGNTADTTTVGGGTAFSTPTETAAIIVNPVNDPPSFTKGIDQNLLANQGAQTVTPWATAISFGPGNEAGQTVVFTVTGNTNPALFSVVPSVNPSGTLTYTTANDAVGSATITIVLKDNGGGADTSPPQSFTINVSPGNTTTALISSANPSVFGVSNTFTATVTASLPSGGTPQGTVNFKDGASTIGSGTLNASGVATFATSSLTVGSHTITAEYVASSSFNTSTSSSVIQVVRANPAVSVVSSQNPSNLGANVTFTATVTPPAGVTITPTGTVQFKDGGANIGGSVNCAAAAGNTCTAQVSTSTLTSGTHVITADYVGDANFNATTGTLSGSQIVSALIRFSSAAYATTESSFAATITVERVGDLTSTVSVDYATPDDSAATPTILPCSTPGFVSSRCDFTTTMGRLTFAPGETSKTFTVQISQDNYVEGPESLTLTLSNVSSNAVLGSPTTATLTISDDATEPAANPIDDATNFVRQHYHDFLNREPVPGDQAGLDFWTSQIESCGSDQGCRDIKRQNVSAAFFLSIEFQQTGYYVYRTYKAGFGDINPPTVPVPVRYQEFIRDTQKVQDGVVVGQGSWQARLDSNKQAYALAFVQRPEFLAHYPGLMNATAFVNALDANAGGVLTSSEWSTLIAELSANSSDAALRAGVLMKVAENAALKQQQFNRAFVLMQYFGYLRRNPGAAPEAGLNFNGFNFWLNKLNSFNGNFIQADMVKAFITSSEYRGRFGQ